MSTTDGRLKLNLASCVVRKTRSLGALVLCSCTTARWAFGCSDTVMANIWRIVYHGSAYILLGRWIDANHHIHVHRKPRGRRKVVSPFMSTFWGGVPLFIIRPISFSGSFCRCFLCFFFKYIFRVSSQFLTKKGQASIPSFFLFLFPIPFIIFALLFSLLPSRNSDPGSHRRLFSAPAHYGSCLAFFMVGRFQLFLPASTRVELCLPTLLIGDLSSWSFFIFANKFKISPQRISNSRTNTSSIRGLPLVHRGDRHLQFVICHL